MLEVHDIHKTYEGSPLLVGVSFDVSSRGDCVSARRIR